MVVDADIEGATRFGDSFGRLDVAAARHGISGRVVVHQDQSGRADFKRTADDLAGIDGRVVDRAVGDRLSQQSVLGVQEQDPKPLERRMRHVSAQIIDQLLAGGKHRATEGFMLEAPQHYRAHRAEQLDCCRVANHTCLRRRRCGENR